MLGSLDMYLCTEYPEYNIETHLFRLLIAPRSNAILVSSLVHVDFPDLSTSFTPSIVYLR